MGDFRPGLDAALSAFGLDATVTLPAGPAVDTTVFWLPSRTQDYSTAADYRRAEARRVMVFPIDNLPEVPRGTLVTVPEALGGDVRTWRVDEAEKLDWDHYRAVVVLHEVTS